jgi:hypothetical protein
MPALMCVHGVAPPIADTLLAPARSLEMTIVWTPAVRAHPLNSYVSVNTDNRAARLSSQVG